MQNDKILLNEGTVQNNEIIENEVSTQVDDVMENDVVMQADDAMENDVVVQDEDVSEETMNPDLIVTEDELEEIPEEPIVEAEELSEDSSPRSRRVVRKKNDQSRVYAGFFVRFTAYLLDKIIVGVPLIIVRMIIWLLQDLDSSNILLRKIFFSFTLTDVILYLVSIAYFVFLTYFMGRTFGKRIMKLKVVSSEDRKPTFFEIAFREIIGRYLSTVILYIGYLMIGAGDQKEALHDYLADTRVVYALD